MTLLDGAGADMASVEAWGGDEKVVDCRVKRVESERGRRRREVGGVAREFLKRRSADTNYLKTSSSLSFEDLRRRLSNRKLYHKHKQSPQETRTREESELGVNFPALQLAAAQLRPSAEKSLRARAQPLAAAGPTPAENLFRLLQFEALLSLLFFGVWPLQLGVIA